MAKQRTADATVYVAYDWDFFKLKAQKQECIVLLNGHYLSSSLLPSLICLLHLNLMLERLKWEKERKRRPYWNGTEKKMDFSFRWHLTNIWHQNVCAIFSIHQNPKPWLLIRQEKQIHWLMLLVLLHMIYCLVAAFCHYHIDYFSETFRLIFVPPSQSSCPVKKGNKMLLRS